MILGLDLVSCNNVADTNFSKLPLFWQVGRGTISLEFTERNVSISVISQSGRSLMLAALAHYANTFNYTTSNGPITTTHTSLTPVWTLGTFLVVALGATALLVVAIVAMVKVFMKAGRPGWAAIVPFYNSWLLAEMAGKPGWWGLYPLVTWIPFLGWLVFIVVSVILALGLAKNFGKSPVFGVFGLFIFSIIGYLILGFGDAKYQGPGRGGAPTAAVPSDPSAPMAPPPMSPPTNPMPPAPPAPTV